MSEKKKEKILLLTDVPLCKNYSGGIMTSQLLRFLLEEKHELFAFIPWNKNLHPEWDESVIHDMKIYSFDRPCEKIVSENEQKKYNTDVMKLKEKLMDCIKTNGITKIWCINQGEVICNLMNYIYSKTKIEYVVQIWDPIEWWMDCNSFSLKRKEKLLKEYRKLINNSKKCITTSRIMSKYYMENYSASCIEVMPSLEKKYKSVAIKNINEFHIAISGQIYAVEEMENFISALDILEWKINEKKVYLHYFGEWDKKYIDLSNHKKYSKQIILEGFVVQTELVPKLSAMDLLYCPYFFSSEETLKKVSSLSFPSKLVTYLSTDSPIIIHAPSYASPNEFCEEYNCAYLLETNNPNEIAEYIRSNINDKENIIKVNNMPVAFEKNFSVNVVKRNFFAALNIEYDKSKKLRILEVNNVDLPGRRFNGYDLLQEINENTTNLAKQIVTYKSSNNKNVLKYYPNQEAISEEWKLMELEKDILSVHSQLSYTSNILKNNDCFKRADVVHYHLIHNTKLSLYSMIELCSEHPSVLTIHDPWIFTGRCAYNQECEKWLTGCHDCEFLDNLFPFTEDNCHSLWELKKKVYNNLDIDIVVSTPFMLDMVKKSPLTKHFKNVHVIPFGIDLTCYRSDSERESSRKEFNIPKDDVVLFFRSQMAMKGTEYIVEAMKMLNTKKRITLLSCDEVGNLESLKKKYNVIELGNIGNEKMIAAFNACDVFLMPSRGESFGLMSIEAMAAGRPIIIFNNSASPSVTFAPECGVLVENKNSEKLMEAIKWMVEDEQERIKRGKLGRKLAEEHYDLIEYHKKINQLYEKVYNRQKDKAKIIINKKINYNDIDTQKILNHLEKIWKKLNCYTKFKTIFPLYSKNNPKLKRIDYSKDSVQEAINLFNLAIYEEKKGIFYPPVTEFDKIEETPYIRKKDRISSFLKKRKITLPLFYIGKVVYLVLRKIKRTLRKVGEKLTFKNRFYIVNDKVNRLEEKLYSTMLYTEALERKIINQQEQIELSNIDRRRYDDKYNLVKNHSEQLRVAVDNINSELSNQQVYNGNQILKINSENELISNKLNNFENKIIGRASNIFFYHGGSGNHGCEALVRTIFKLGNVKREGSVICSYVMSEDYKYYIDEIVENILDSNQDTKELDNLYFTKDAIAYSIGGDNYCGYDYGTKRLEKYNTFFNNRKIKTALIGCSIEPSVLEHQEVLNDLHNYSLITARESITYEALLAKGLNRNTHLVPDSAFTLEPTLLPLPMGFEEGNTIGINISNMVQSYDKEENLTYSNYVNLIKHLIENTKYQIALIPHVVQPHNDDLKSLEKLYDEFKDFHERIILINEHNCSEIKGYIKRCKILVCTRTHASISGYSSLVPTLVLGYSVKSRGIAKDIFGTSENYVVPVESLKSVEDLTKSFIYFEQNYSKIKKNLEEVMPNYISKCYQLTELVEELKKSEYTIKKLPNDFNCTGCMTCSVVCPQKCIAVGENKIEFIAPIVDYTKCIECNICRDKCPINNYKIENYNAKFYAVMNKDKNIRRKSTSGGIFYALAKNILNEKGVVFGAALTDNHQLKHISINNLSDMSKIMKSKYIQSDLGNTFAECKELLEKQVKVLFCATPCQIAGLKSYLVKDYANLVCVDFVCHGVPSQKEFDKHVKYLENKYGKKVKSFDFRDKSNSWMEYKVKVTFEDDTSIKMTKAEDEYVHNFLANINLRDCCYNCQFNNFRNYSDITIGDLWGAKEKIPEMFDDKGTSLVILNTNVGENIFKDVNNEIEVKPITREIATHSNYSILNNLNIPEERENYFKKTS